MLIQKLFNHECCRLDNIEKNLNILLNTSRDRSYFNYGLRPIEDYKRESIFEDTLLIDLYECIDYYEKRLTDVHIVDVYSHHGDELKTYHIKAKYQNEKIQINVVVEISGRVNINNIGYQCE